MTFTTYNFEKSAYINAKNEVRKRYLNGTSRRKLVAQDALESIGNNQWFRNGATGLLYFPSENATKLLDGNRYYKYIKESGKSQTPGVGSFTNDEDLADIASNEGVRTYDCLSLTDGISNGFSDAEKYIIPGFYIMDIVKTYQLNLNGLVAVNEAETIVNYDSYGDSSYSKRYQFLSPGPTKDILQNALSYLESFGDGYVVISDPLTPAISNIGLMPSTDKRYDLNNFPSFSIKGKDKYVKGTDFPIAPSPVLNSSNTFSVVADSLARDTVVPVNGTTSAPMYITSYLLDTPIKHWEGTIYEYEQTRDFEHVLNVSQYSQALRMSSFQTSASIEYAEHQGFGSTDTKLNPDFETELLAGNVTENTKLRIALRAVVDLLASLTPFSYSYTTPTKPDWLSSAGGSRTVYVQVWDTDAQQYVDDTTKVLGKYTATFNPNTALYTISVLNYEALGIYKKPIYMDIETLKGFVEYEAAKYTEMEGRTEGNINDLKQLDGRFKYLDINDNLHVYTNLNPDRLIHYSIYTQIIASLRAGKWRDEELDTVSVEYFNHVKKEMGNRTFYKVFNPTVNIVTGEILEYLVDYRELTKLDPYLYTLAIQLSFLRLRYEVKDTSGSLFDQLFRAAVMIFIAFYTGGPWAAALTATVSYAQITGQTALLEVLQIIQIIIAVYSIGSNLMDPSMTTSQYAVQVFSYSVSIATFLQQQRYSRKFDALRSGISLNKKLVNEMEEIETSIEAQEKVKKFIYEEQHDARYSYSYDIEYEYSYIR